MKAAPQVEVSSRQALREWLLAHHTQAGSIWLVTFKKAAGARHLPPQVIVEEALAFGWIDSVPRALDAERTMRLLSPRRAGSAWSKVNKRLVAAMTARGEMHAAGLAKVAAAKADGSWFKLDAVETLALPEDLSRALDRDVQARTHFLAFPPQRRDRSGGIRVADIDHPPVEAELVMAGPLHVLEDARVAALLGIE